MPHIIVEYSANIEGQLDAPALLRKLHDDTAAHDIAAYKIKSRLHRLDHYIIGDEKTETSMVHATCLLLEGRPVEFGYELSADLFKVIQDHIKARQIEKCAASIELREMKAESYNKS